MRVKREVKIMNQTSCDTSENNGAQSEEDNTERDGVNGGAENKGSAVTGD